MAKRSAKTSRQGSRLSAALAVLWRTLCHNAFDPYRPELHYMRGQGPKWRAKHAVAETAPAPTHGAAATA